MTADEKLNYRVEPRHSRNPTLRKYLEMVQDVIVQRSLVENQLWDSEILIWMNP
jgi:hypothetical protein